MRIFLISTLLLLSMTQANAAHYHFSQLFTHDGINSGSVVGSFDVAATTGIVNESQISNFLLTIPDGLSWGDYEDSRQISFNLDAKQLDLSIISHDVDNIYDQEGHEFIRTITYRYAGGVDSTGTFGVFNQDCQVEPIPDIIYFTCKGFPNYTIVTNEPIVVTQTVVPLPSALGLYSLGMVLTNFISIRFRKHRVSAI